MFTFEIVLGRKKFVGLKVRIFGGFRWVCNSVLVDEPGFGRDRSLVFPNLGLGLAYFWLNRFEVWAFRRGLNWFEVRFWWMNLGSSEFKVRLIKFEEVRSSLYLGSIQH